MSTDEVLLADGTLIAVAVHEGLVLWAGEEQAINIHALDGTPMIGMALMRGQLLQLPVVAGSPFNLMPIAPESSHTSTSLEG